MIPAIFQTTAWSILALLNLLLSTINFVIPTEIYEGFNYLIGQTYIFQGILPMETLWSAIFTIISAWLLIESVKIIAKGISMIPGINLDIITKREKNTKK